MTISTSETLTTIVCSACGVTFAIPKRMEESRREDKGTFYCPNGHGQVYRVSEAERLRKELELANAAAQASKSRYLAELDQRVAAERERDREKQKHARLKNRVKAGVCPCCNRSFCNLRRHIETKHPHYAGDDRKKAVAA